MNDAMNPKYQPETLAVRAGQAREDVLETFEDDDADAMVSPNETATPRHAAQVDGETLDDGQASEPGDKHSS